MSVPPLTTRLCRAGWSDKTLGLRKETFADFFAVAKNAFAVLRKEEQMIEFHVDQTGFTLFGAIPNAYLQHVLRGNKYMHAPSGGGWSYASQLTPGIRRFLLRKLYWFKKLKPIYKYKLYSMCDTPDDFQKLSNLLQNAEGRVMASLLAVGDRIGYNDIDMLNVSIVSNLLNCSRFQKTMKSYLKRVRQAFLCGRQLPKPRRETTFLYSWANLCLTGNATEDEAAYRITTFCQGRAMGIPTPTLVEDSAKKWVKNVTQEDPRSHEEYDLRTLEETLAVAPQSLKKIRAHARISISTSACLEMPKAKGGKLAFAKRLLETPSYQKVDLETGLDLPEYVESRRQPGEALFHYSLRDMRDNFDERMQVRASSVNEGGAKSRIITVNAFSHGCILSPWSHMWLKVLQEYPAARAGITEGRHGWAFVRSLTASRPDLAWVFERAELAMLSTDLSEATDHLFWSATEALLRMAHRVLRIPTWYSEFIIRCLTTSRHVKFRAGKFFWEGDTSCATFMGDSGCKVILTLANLFAVIRIGLATMAVSAVVGDDHITLTSDAGTALEIYEKTVSHFGLQVSEDDTVISNRYGFFAEELIRIPDDNRGTIDALIRATAKRDLPYYDVTKVRLLMDIRKDRKDFASTSVGRIYQFGREMEYNLRPTQYIGLVMMASWFQDVCLDLRHKPEFVYFPRALVSGGKPLLFSNEQNFKDWIVLHKHGRLLGRYHWLMETAVTGGLNHGVIPRFFTKTDEHRLAVVTQRELPEQIVPLKLFTTPKKSWYQPLIVGRLTDYVISETEIKSRLNQLDELFSETLAATPATVENLALEASQPSEEILDRFLEVWKTNSLLLGREAVENYYPREEVMQILDLENPMHVDIPIDWAGRTARETRAEKMLERERDELALYEWVKSGRDDLPPTDIIADDPVIVEEASKISGPEIFIVTRDRELCSYVASKNWRKLVWMISPLRWIQAGYTGKPVLTTEQNDSVIIDQGSLDAEGDDLTPEQIDRLLARIVPLISGDLELIKYRGHTKVPREITDGNMLALFRSRFEDRSD
jgi:hypothetical protein